MANRKIERVLRVFLEITCSSRVSSKVLISLLRRDSCASPKLEAHLKQQDAKRLCNMLHGPCGSRNGPDEVFGRHSRPRSCGSPSNFAHSNSAQPTRQLATFVR